MNFKVYPKTKCWKDNSFVSKLGDMETYKSSYTFVHTYKYVDGDVYNCTYPKYWTEFGPRGYFQSQGWSLRCFKQD